MNSGIALGIPFNVLANPSPSTETTYYLSLDGVDDYLKTPSITFDEVVMEFKARQTPTTEYYLDARTGVANTYLYRNTSNVDFTSGSALFVNSMYWDGVKGTNSTTFIPTDTRGILRLVLSAASTDDITFFANNTGAASTCMAADVFSIKLLLGGVVKAHYDMTKGNVQDQSGNNNHATLTGGIWVTV